MHIYSATIFGIVDLDYKNVFYGPEFIIPENQTIWSAIPYRLHFQNKLTTHFTVSDLQLYDPFCALRKGSGISFTNVKKTIRKIVLSSSNFNMA